MFPRRSGKNSEKFEIRLYDGPPPGSENWDWAEKSGNRNSLSVSTVWNIVNPTLTVFQPEQSKTNGTSIVICPGGGFHFLAIEHEGGNIARELVKQGITVFILKYRLFHVQHDNPFDEMLHTPDKKAWDRETEPIIPLAIADGRQAIAYVRRNAAELGVRNDRIGIMGFSAGGLVAASSAFNYTKDNRPDFVVAAYPDLPESRQSLLLSDAPPLFLICATDDELGFPANVISLYHRWYTAKAPVEMHLYARGGHGFGIGTENNTTGTWISQFVQWLDLEGFM